MFIVQCTFCKMDENAEVEHVGKLSIVESESHDDLCTTLVLHGEDHTLGVLRYRKYLLQPFIFIRFEHNFNDFVFQDMCIM